MVPKNSSRNAGKSYPFVAADFLGEGHRRTAATSGFTLNNILSCNAAYLQLYYSNFKCTERPEYIRSEALVQKSTMPKIPPAANPNTVTGK